MKKLLALVLALVMTLSLAVSANAAFTDADKINESYAEAANVLTGMGVLKGYTDGSFKPEGAITRAEVAAVVYRIYTADVTDKNVGLYTGYGKFNDLAGANWAKGYIGYCANAGLVRGYNDTTFGPLDNVTGYQALAMILRAMGYDKNGEFAGKDWQLHVAQTAQQLGILKNAGSENLAAPASRQLVAELLFQAIQKPCVSYTPAFGYVPNTVVGVQQSLGVKNFTLTLKEDTQDVWGRPSHTWTYTTGNKKTVVAQKADAVYYTKVSECDIAKDLGISTSTALEKAFIDADSMSLTSPLVTSNRYASINPLATASLVGGQGRITEAYIMSDGKIRLVEINTYLAQVTKVTAAYTDPNGHVIDATIDLSVFDALKNARNDEMNKVADWSFKGVKATGFTKGQYVLVTISNPGSNVAPKAAVQSVEAANVVAGGAIAGWTNAIGVTPATTVIGATTYKDADKFEKNYRPTAGNWMVALDKYENVIGLVESAVNYLVIEKIEWKANQGSIGGFASADLILATGEKVPFATIATINGNPATNTDKAGTPGNHDVSDFYYNNGGANGYYGHIFTYSVNENGSYNITKHEVPTDANRFFDVTGNGTVTKGVATINAGVNTYVGTNNTVYMLLNSDGYTYTVYTGKNNVPSVRNANLCIMTDANGYATLVVIKGELSSNTFYAYVTEKDANGRFYSSTKGYQYTVYKVGETTPTYIYGEKSNLALMQADWVNGAWHGTGLYQFVVNSDTQIDTVKAVSPILCDTHCETDYAVAGWDRAAVKAFVVGESFQAQGYSDIVAATEEDADNGYSVTVKTGDAAKIRDYNVITEGDNATKFIVVTKSSLSSDASLSVGTMDDLTKNSIVLVNYSAIAADNGQINYTAKTVYILKVVEDDINKPATTGSIHYTVNFYRYLDGVAVLNDTATYTSKNLTPGTYVYGYSAEDAAAAGYTGAYTASWILSEVNANPAVWEVNYATPSVTVKAGQTAEVVLEVYPIGNIH